MLFAALSLLLLAASSVLGRKYPRLELRSGCGHASLHSAELETALSRAPQLSGLSRESVLRNIDYLNFLSSQTAHDSDEVLSGVLEHFPSFFSLALETQLAVRIAYSNTSLDALLRPDGSFTALRRAVTGGGVESSSFYKTFKARFTSGGLACAKSGDIDMLRLLLTHGYVPSADTDNNGMNSLHWALCFNRNQTLDIAKLLIGHDGGIVHARSNDGSTSMHWAATGGNLASCQHLLGLVDAYVPNSQGSLPLHWACGSGSTAVVEMLLGEQAAATATSYERLSLKNNFGCTVVHFAASGGRLEVCQLLLRHGCDFHERNGHGHDALTKAVAFKKADVVEWLLAEVPGVRETIDEPREWDGKPTSLADIARIVGGRDIEALLGRHGGAAREARRRC